MRHVVENVFHGPAVRNLALPLLFTVAVVSVRLLSPLALVGVQQKHKLLLDQFPFLRIGTRLTRLTTSDRSIASESSNISCRPWKDKSLVVEKILESGATHHSDAERCEEERCSGIAHLHRSSWLGSSW